MNKQVHLCFVTCNVRFISTQCMGACHCRYLEEYLDNKRPMSPLSPLSPLPQTPESNKPTPKTKTAEQHHSHTQKSRDKNRDTAVKVTLSLTCLGHYTACGILSYLSPPYSQQPKTEVEIVKVSRQTEPSSESSWAPAGHKGTVPNNEM